MKKEIVKINKKNNVSKMIIALLTIVFLAMFIAKGGYFKSDIIGFNFLAIAIGLGYIGYSVYENIKKEENFKFTIMDMAVVIYSLSYSLPIIFKNTASTPDAFIGAIKYIGFACIYFCAKKIFKLERNEKTSYVNIIFKIFTLISTLFCILGLDELSIKAFSGILKSFGISYIAADYRLSSIFQYANASAIFIAIGAFVTIYLCMSAKKNSSKIIYISIIYLQVMCLFLTQSRTTIGLFIIMLVIMALLVKDKFTKNKVITLEVFTLGYIAIFFTVIYQFIKLETRWQIILLFIVSNLIYNFIASFYLVFAKEFKKVIESKKYIATFIIASISILAIIGIIMFGLKTDLLVTGIEKRKVKVDGKENIPFRVTLNELENNQNFGIKVEGLNKNHILVYTKEYNKENLKENKIVDIVPKNVEIKYLLFHFINTGSNYSVNKIEVDNKNVTTDYLLLPYDIVGKIQDVLIGSSSFKERTKYYKDAIAFSKENFFIGKGGYTFQNMYQSFQRTGYISSEAHSYIIDILLDVGLIGLISYILIICCGIKNLFYGLQTEKEENIKYANLTAIFILMILHSLVDLDFSFNIILMIFAIVIANIPQTKEYEIKYGIVKSIIAVSILFAYFIIATRMYIADSILNFVKENKSLTAEKRVKKIKIARMLDSNSFDVAKQYIAENESYKKELKAKVVSNKATIKDQENINETVKEIRVTALDIYQKNAYSKKALEEVAKAYIRNFLNFATYDNSFNYDKYLDVSFRAIEDIIKAGDLNVNNYHVAVNLLHNIYMQLEYVEKQLNINLSTSILKAKESILNIEEVAKKNFEAKGQNYYESFIDPFRETVNKYKEAEMN